jgi:tyrosyl-tRNA synthetase
MQGYDSVALNIDVEVGGNDQLFNMLAGRDLVMNRLNKEKFVVAMKLLEANDGTKMGKTSGNMIELSDSANNIFGKVMAFDDKLIPIGFEILTKHELEQVEEIKERLKKGENPMILKKLLAFEITKDIKGEQEAENAQKYFENVFQKKNLNTDIPIRTVRQSNINILDLIVQCKITNSKSQAKRLVEQNAVTINGEKITDWNKNIQVGSGSTILKCGKHVYKVKYIPN